MKWCNKFKEQWKRASREAGEVNNPLLISLIFIGCVGYWKLPDAGTSVVGGTVALIIAFIAYPWQKNHDRRLQVGLEQRKAYGEVVEELFKARSALEAFKFDEKIEIPERLTSVFGAIKEFEACIQRHAILVDANLVTLAQRSSETLRDGLSEFGKKLEGLEATADDIDGAVVNKMLEGSKSEALTKFSRVATDMINEIRRTSFGLEDAVTISERFARNPHRAD